MHALPASMSHTPDKQPLLPLPVDQKFARLPVVHSTGLRWRPEIDFANQDVCLPFLEVHVRHRVLCSNTWMQTCQNLGWNGVLPARGAGRCHALSHQCPWVIYKLSSQHF